jgi:dTDP-4-dehydrorhamnose reductase
MILVVGGDSMIGAALVGRLERAGKSVVSTTRRRETTGSSRLFLDLSGDVDEWELPARVSVAVLCAGVTKIEECQRDPASTSHINVVSTVKLARRLTAAGAFTVYLSTNQVFDGSMARRRPHDLPSPQTEYGKQKAQVEREIAALGSDAVSIVRLTKVFGSKPQLLEGWINSLRHGDVIHPFRNMLISPVSLDFVVSALERVIDRRLPGILHVSGDTEISYAEVAYYLAKKLGIAAHLVQPVDSIEAGIPAAAAPRHTSLDTTRLSAELELEPPNVWTAIASAFSMSEHSN